MKNKKIIISVVVVILLIIAGWFLSTGGARTDVFLRDFSFDEKCNQMTIKVGVSSSAGYVRKMKQTSGSMNGYYTFYSTFGINSRLGAEDTFEIQLDNNVDEIFFYTGGKGYTKVLEKNEKGVWVKVNDKSGGYQLVSTLKKVQHVSTEILVQFDGVLYGKSNAIIDYAGGTEKIGVIDKVIDSNYVPKFDNETNREEIKNAEVYDKTDKSIVLLYNNEYVLFEKIY
ncbi:MAG: hypothetical protein E7174_02445 [Firmicutes bacterium]|nr:hypothetical protein [Bacillota bacterium]